MSNPHRPIPSKTECRRIGDIIKEYLFNNDSFRLSSFDQVLYILNRISKGIPAAFNMVGRWGDCVAAIARMREIFAVFGTKGSYLQLQNKQALTASIMVQGNGVAGSLVMNNKASNKKLLKQLLPHKQDKHRNKWIAVCGLLLTAFIAGNCRHLCKQYVNLHRESLV